MLNPHRWMENPTAMDDHFGIIELWIMIGPFIHLTLNLQIRRARKRSWLTFIQMTRGIYTSTNYITLTQPKKYQTLSNHKRDTTECNL